MDLPQRKLQRLKNFDYSQCGAYFITICTQNKIKLFGDISEHGLILNHAGKMVEEKLTGISNGHGVAVDQYIVMPDHVHAIMIIGEDETTHGAGGATPRGRAAPSLFHTLSEVVQRFKTITTKLYIDGVRSGNYPPFDKKIWQKSFNDRIIRNEKGYQEAWRYIDENPAKWLETKHL